MYESNGKGQGQGRKGYWIPEFVERAYKLALLGLTDEQIGIAFGVARTVIDYWKQHKPEFVEALERGKDEADSNVAHSLYQRAIGYHHKDTVINMYKGKIIKTIVTKYYPPDAYACLKWLAIRQPEKWADIQKIELSGQLSVSHYLVEQIKDVNQFSDTELEALLKLGLSDITHKIKELQPAQSN